MRDGWLRRVLTSISLDTPWPRAPATRWFVGVAALGLVTLLLPRTTGWTGNYLHSEDGQVFLTAYLRDGVGTLFQTYAGYLHLTPRLLAASCGLGSPDHFASCIAVSSSLVRVAVMAIAFPVLSAYAGSWKWGLFAASAALVFLPAGQQEVLGNITNLRWFLLAGAFFSLIGVFRSRPLAAYAALLGALAALSEPQVILLAPLAIWRAASTKGWGRLPAVVVLIGSAVHLLSLDTSARGERGGLVELITTPMQTFGQLLVRGPLTTQWGLTLTQDLTRTVGFPLAIATLVLTGVLLILGWRGRRPQDPAVPFSVLMATVGMGFLFVTLSFPASYIALADFWSPSQPGRYSALTGAFLTPVLVLAMARAWSSRRDPRLGRVWVFVMCGTLALAYVGDARGDARNTNGPSWSQTVATAREHCARFGTDPRVPNSPVYEGWTTTLTCDWLGVR